MMLEIDKFLEILFFLSEVSLIFEYSVFAIKISSYFDRLCQSKTWQL